MAALELPPGRVGRLVASVQQGEVLLRLALCMLAAVILWAVTNAWKPPQGYRTGQVPDRDITARIDFEQEDPEALREAQQRAESLALAVYEQDPTALIQLRSNLLIALNRAASVESLDDLGIETWQKFEARPPNGKSPPTAQERAQQFSEFSKQLKAEGALEKLEKAVAEAMRPLEQRGMRKEDLLSELKDNNKEKIYIRPKDNNDFPVEVSVGEVLDKNVAQALGDELTKRIAMPDVAARILNYLQPQLPNTLTLRKDLTEAERKRAKDAVGKQYKTYLEGAVLAKAGQPISKENLVLLETEHQKYIEALPVQSRLMRTLAEFGMYVALYTLCGFYIHLREPDLIAKIPRFVSLLSLVVVTVTLCQLTARDTWRAEMIPLLIFAMTIAIAYHQELALLLSAAVGLVVVVSLGQGLPEMVTLTAAVAAAVLMLRSVRTRSKLLVVGICSGAVALLTTIGVGTLVGRPLFAGELMDFNGLVWDGVRFGVWGIIAGSLMTCLLPFIERMFAVQTDLSLIELGDPAHPLLQELIRRAPGTYNHSITVASLAEAAAEAIGARALLVRVGAYFHDIGKMLKPGYFVENQSDGDNRHESLVPAMSTLVIIAHVKDGADLARQHHLPESIIDFILQHHGTTLVEYFYRRASEQSQADPNGGEVDESSFRYPGPKPQTKEAAVMMLADAVESASRVLVDPAPARIESLVEELAMKRLLDGQFDECGLTLQELHAIQESLVKSLTAVYHGRVKYPDQQTA